MAKVNFSNIHSRLESKLQLQAKANRDKPIAWELQSVLRMLKQRRNKIAFNNNIVFEELERQMDDIIIPQVTAAIHKKSTTALFRRKHGTSTIADDIFEEELAAVIATIENEATGTNLSVSSKIIGNELVNIAFNKPTKKIMEKYPQFIEQKLRGQLNSANRDYTGTVSRSGKGDVRGTSIQIKGIIKPEWEYLYNLFRGRTFSVKNYSSYSANTSIHLGGTDYYKAIMGSLYALGYSEKYASQIFYEGISDDAPSEAPQHFHHLQVGYELMGLGQGRMSSNGEFQEMQQVDFFIYNDPATDVIVVKSTAEMMLDLINQTQHRNKYISEINVSKKYFQQLGATRIKRK